MTDQPVSPTECRHRGMLFVQSFRSLEYRSHVSLCPHCGVFMVHVDHGIGSATVTFALSSDEELRAAGQYIRYIARPNNAVHLTPAAVDACDDNDTEPQAQVTADR